MSHDTGTVILMMKAVSPDIVPAYQTAGASGADLFAHIEQELIIQPGCSMLVPTGVFLEIPEGFEAQVRSRSGLAATYQVCVLNSPGTIDSDYRGEIKVILINHGKNSFVVTPKMRIAQIVISPVAKASFVSIGHLQNSQRGDGGFGHTGF